MDKWQTMDQLPAEYRLRRCMELNTDLTGASGTLLPTQGGWRSSS